RKHFTVNSGAVRRCLALLIMFLAVAYSAAAQIENPVKNPAGTLPVRQDTIPPDTLSNRSDSLNVALDSANIQQDSVPPPRGDIETTINYTARDSIRASIDGKMIWLYGDAKITYGAIELEADEI